VSRGPYRQVAVIASAGRISKARPPFRCVEGSNRPVAVIASAGRTLWAGPSPVPASVPAPVPTRTFTVFRFSITNNKQLLFKKETNPKKISITNYSKNNEINNYQIPITIKNNEVNKYQVQVHQRNASQRKPTSQLPKSGEDFQRR
jgi:molecular chaperone DnaK (HSP70)